MVFLETNTVNDLREYGQIRTFDHKRTAAWGMQVLFCLALQAKTFLVFVFGGEGGLVVAS